MNELVDDSPLRFQQESFRDDNHKRVDAYTHGKEIDKNLLRQAQSSWEDSWSVVALSQTLLQRFILLNMTFLICISHHSRLIHRYHDPFDLPKKCQPSGLLPLELVEGLEEVESNLSNHVLCHIFVDVFSRSIDCSQLTPIIDRLNLLLEFIKLGEKSFVLLILFFIGFLLSSFLNDSIARGNDVVEFNQRFSVFLKSRMSLPHFMIESEAS